jgi:folate-dependent phosphoribosylglycinamide formyltransferase PurN
VLFQSIVIPVLNLSAAAKNKKIISDAKLNDQEVSGPDVRFVDSVNSKETATFIEEFKPDIVIVNGTRIISKNILSRISCPIINMHAGITPAYRGVHGAYWALYNNDVANCGVTVHRVDAGIDTGGIISQAIIKVDSYEAACRRITIVTERG